MSQPSSGALEMIRQLIAFDTTSRNSNLELIYFVRDYLAGLGVESELIQGDDAEKANLFATLGPTDRPGIALSGHTDVVPIDGQEWDSDPWTVIEQDGKLYGRGTCDMKSFVAIALAQVPRFLEADPKTPIHLCFSYDEEVGCLGVRPMLKQLAAREIRPMMAIVGEPTDMKVINAHKGKLSYTCHVRGMECHSSLAPTGVNAIEYASRLIGKLLEMAERKAKEGPFDEEYDIPHTTVHTGVIHGGTALNIVPKDCTFQFEFRYLPEEGGAALLKEVQDYAFTVLQPAMQRIDADSGFRFEELSAFPGLDTPTDHDVVQMAKALTGANATSKVAFGTEGGLFSQHDMPAVICGPGSIEQAHKPNEFVALEQIALCEAFMERLAERVAAS